MSGSTTVTGNKGRTRKTSARTKVRYSWRKRAIMAHAYIVEAKRRLAALTEAQGL